MVVKIISMDFPYIRLLDSGCSAYLVPPMMILARSTDLTSGRSQRPATRCPQAKVYAFQFDSTVFFGSGKAKPECLTGTSLDRLAVVWCH